MGLMHIGSVGCSSELKDGPSVRLASATLSQMENSTLIIAALEIIFLHKGKEEGMTLDGGWEKTTFTSHVCSCFSVCIAVLASNQFFCLYCCVGIQPVFFACIAVLASNKFCVAHLL